MSLVGWLLLFEVAASLLLLVWLLRKAHHHVRQNPAEKALNQHLVELKSASDVNEPPVKVTKSRKAKKP